MDENNTNSSPLSYDAPKAGEYGGDKPKEAVSENTSAESSASTTSAFSLNTDNANSGNSTTSNSTPNSFTSQTTFNQTSQSTSNQEVFGGTVEGGATSASSANNYNTNYYSPYSNGSEEISKGFAIASLVMGILSIITCCCSITGILFGILGIIFYCVQQKDSEGKRPTQATIGLVLSIIGLVIAVGSVIFGLLASGTDWYQEILRNAQSV